MDKAARQLGLAPQELRRRNLVPPERFPYTTAFGITYDSGEYEAVLDQALELADVGGFERRKEQAKKAGRLRGIGLACFVEVSGGVPIEWGALHISPDGSVEVTSGIQNIGTGHETTFAQIVTERLGVAFDRVRIRYGDTRYVKRGPGTHASRSTLMAGTVLSMNMTAAIARGCKIAAHLFGVDESEVSFAAGCFEHAPSHRAVSLLEVVRRGQEADIPEELRGEFRFEAEYMRNLDVQTASSGCHICEVEIDHDTCEVHVVRYAAVDAVGRVINPPIVHGQVRGGVAQGIGQALLEQIAYDSDSGQLLTGSFMDYGLPRAADVPTIDVADFEEPPARTNPLGVKGAGEGGAIAAPAAVANATINALSGYGIDHLDLPLTQEKIWRAIRSPH